MQFRFTDVRLHSTEGYELIFLVWRPTFFEILLFVRVLTLFLCYRIYIRRTPVNNHRSYKNLCSCNMQHCNNNIVMRHFWYKWKSLFIVFTWPTQPAQRATLTSYGAAVTSCMYASLLLVIGYRKSLQGQSVYRFF